MSAVTGVSTMVVPPSPLSPDSDLVTVEEFYCLVPDGQKADLIDGVIYLASPDTRRSDRLGGFIKFLMQGYAAVQGLGEVYGSRFAFELSQFRAPEPDAAFVCTERLHLVSERRMVGGPDIAVEIVSPHVQGVRVNHTIFPRAERPARVGDCIALCCCRKR